MMFIQYIIVWAVYFFIALIPFGLVGKLFQIMPDLGGIKLLLAVLMLISFVYLSILARTAAKIFVFEKMGFIESISDANRRNWSTLTIWLCFIPGLGPIFQNMFNLDEETMRQKENRRKIADGR